MIVNTKISREKWICIYTGFTCIILHCQDNLNYDSIKLIWSYLLLLRWAMFVDQMWRKSEKRNLRALCYRMFNPVFWIHSITLPTLSIDLLCIWCIDRCQQWWSLCTFLIVKFSQRDWLSNNSTKNGSHGMHR